MPGRFETVDESRENLKKNGLKTMARSVTKTWFVKGEDAKYFDFCIEAGTQTSIEAADNSLAALKKWNGVDKLKNIKNETLIIWGNKDKSYNLSQVKILEKNIPNSSLVTFDRCAHNVHLEKIEKFNRTVLNFINNE